MRASTALLALLSASCSDPVIDDSVTGAMVLVPAGSFFMGCNPDVDDACEADEQPGRTITLSAYEIDVTEVTQRAYARCVDDGPCTAPVCSTGEEAYDPALRPDHPVVCVTWRQAEAFCAWAGKRLPTEAEWEKAARGDDGRRYPWGNDDLDCTRANVVTCGGGPSEVGLHPLGVSPSGAHDMSGNVCEWVADWYLPVYYQLMPDVDPPGPSSGTERGVRDGNFNLPPDRSRASARHNLSSPDAHPVLGFRCAR